MPKKIEPTDEVVALWVRMATAGSTFDQISDLGPYDSKFGQSIKYTRRQIGFFIKKNQRESGKERVDFRAYRGQLVVDRRRAFIERTRVKEPDMFDNQEEGK